MKVKETKILDGLIAIPVAKIERAKKVTAAEDQHNSALRICLDQTEVIKQLFKERGAGRDILPKSRSTAARENGAAAVQPARTAT